MNKTFILALTMAVCTLPASKAQTYLDPSAPLESRVEDALSRMTTHEKIKVLHAQSKFTSAGVPRLGIRQLNMDDGPHGVREELEWNTWSPAKWTNDYVVAFPSLTCLAATWNRDLSQLYGHNVSEEFAFRGKDVLLGPGVNIQRTPLNGRAFEYMGEDPVLAAEMVVPYIEAAQRNGVACCLKHFVLNDQETDRFGVDVRVSERALREIYLYPFEAAVKRAHVWSIMGAYNFWQGVHACQNDSLLNGILKREWQWDGVLVSDWGGTTDTRQAALGGLDIEMGTGTDGKTTESEFTYDDYYLGNSFEKLIEDGSIPLSVLDDKVRRVLRLIFRTAMNPKKVIGSQCSDAHYEACRQIAEEGIVLLKNEAPQKGKGKAILPIDFSLPAAGGQQGFRNGTSPTILVVGENATRSLTQGGGSSELKTLRDVSPLDGLSQAITGHCYTPASAEGEGVRLLYAKGYSSGRALYDHVDEVSPDEQARLKAEALDMAKTADLIIFIGGMNKNSRQDCENGDRESYDLSFGQNELISELAAVQPNTIVVTFGGNPYAAPWLGSVAALLHCWYLGSESGTALANVITGKVCPSGKLPVTFACRYEDYPYVRFGKEAYPGVATGQDGPTTPRSVVEYKEDFFMGYRGFEHDNVQPQFPFGFGLSYTTFRYGKPTLSTNANGWTISADITNTGSCTGKETIQLYTGPARRQKSRPAKELKDFVKISLQPGETKTVTFSITPQQLATWNETTHEWQMPQGKYKAYICASATDEQGAVTFTAE